jgi:hypothetical protein
MEQNGFLPSNSLHPVLREAELENGAAPRLGMRGGIYDPYVSGESPPPDSFPSFRG